jgi:hypothetical protein
MAFPAMPTQVRCPQCSTSFIVQVHTVIDVGAEPELKDQFLRGQLNYARCPQCGAGGVLSTALLYHDPSKELLVSYVPSELGLSADQQEQFIGSLVQAVMNSLPNEQRKAYFLQPRAVLTLEGLYDAILEGDGISKEALEAQRSRLRLLNQLLVAVDDDPTLGKLIEDNRQDLSYEFFLVLSDSIEAYEQDGNQERATRLTALREKLLQKVTPAMPSVAAQEATYDDLIELLKRAEPGEAWRATIALNRRRLDYGFFQALTGKIEAAQNTGDSEAAKSLTELRSRILDEMDAQNRMVREAEDQASLLIMRFSEAQDLAAEAREHRDEIDEVFFSVLTRYRAAAEAQKDTARAQKLANIWEAAINIIEEGLPPDVRLINKLMRSDYPEGTGAVLEENRGLLSDAFLETFDKYTARLGANQEQALAERIKSIRSQIMAKMSVLRA